MYEPVITAIVMAVVNPMVDNIIHKATTSHGVVGVVYHFGIATYAYDWVWDEPAAE